MGATSGFDCIVKVLVIIVVFLFFVDVLYSTNFVVGTVGQFLLINVQYKDTFNYNRNGQSESFELYEQ